MVACNMGCDERASPSTLSAAAGMKGQTKTEMKNPEIGTAEPFQSFSQSLCQPSEPILERL